MHLYPPPAGAWCSAAVSISSTASQSRTWCSRTAGRPAECRCAERRYRDFGPHRAVDDSEPRVNIWCNDLCCVKARWQVQRLIPHDAKNRAAQVLTRPFRPAVAIAGDSERSTTARAQPGGALLQSLPPGDLESHQPAGCGSSVRLRTSLRYRLTPGLGIREFLECRERTTQEDFREVGQRPADGKRASETG